MVKVGPLNLYQKKGRRKAYIVSKRVALVEGKADPEYCGGVEKGTRCIKMKYMLVGPKSNNESRCKSMVSGKFFFSIKKDNAILI